MISLVIFASALLSTVVRLNTQENTAQANKRHRQTDKNNVFGDLFSSFLFAIIICLLNFHFFNPKSFCLMNPLENMCKPHRESLSCARTNNLNLTTGMGNYFDGFAGFFRRNHSKEGKPLFCFLDIGRGSWFQFMALDFGKNRKWTESSFVLVDGEFAPFQPRLYFRSLPRINFGWLLEKNLHVNLVQKTTATGILIFAADSEVNLFYHASEMTGLK